MIPQFIGIGVSHICNLLRRCLLLELEHHDVDDNHFGIGNRVLRFGGLRLLNGNPKKPMVAIDLIKWTMRRVCFDVPLRGRS
jgi:hypothetical protein